MKLIQMSNKASLNEISYFFLHLWHYDLIKIKRRDVRERAVTRSRLHVSSGILLNVLEHFVFFFSRTNKIMWITWSRRSLPQPKRSMNCCLAETRVKVISTGRAKQLYGIQCLSAWSKRQRNPVLNNSGIRGQKKFQSIQRDTHRRAKCSCNS